MTNYVAWVFQSCIENLVRKIQKQNRDYLVQLSAMQYTIKENVLYLPSSGQTNKQKEKSKMSYNNILKNS